METSTVLSLIAAAVFAGLIAFVMTPPIRALARKIGAIDVPADTRRMHTAPIPRMGGMAIFLGFMLASVLFAESSPVLLSIWLGGLIIVVMGVIDDVVQLHPIIKFLVQIAAALVVVAHGLRIDFIRFGDYYLVFDEAAIPMTVLWIVLVTNAMNLIDGLDGLSCGIAAITSLSLTIVMFLRGDTVSALLTAILFGSCMGFLPFNRYPARIFLGDTGSQFLGFLLSVLTLSGLFKMHTVISFFVPVAIFALPLFDTTFAFFRRLFHGKNPFKGDRGHLHHRLIDLGYSQKETVAILHTICGILGIAAIAYSLGKAEQAGYIIIASALILLVYLFLLHPTKKAEAAEQPIGAASADIAEPCASASADEEAPRATSPTALADAPADDDSTEIIPSPARASHTDEPTLRESMQAAGLSYEKHAPKAPIADHACDEPAADDADEIDNIETEDAATEIPCDPLCEEPSDPEPIPDRLETSEQAPLSEPDPEPDTVLSAIFGTDDHREEASEQPSVALPDEPAWEDDLSSSFADPSASSPALSAIASDPLPPLPLPDEDSEPSEETDEPELILPHRLQAELERSDAESIPADTYLQLEENALHPRRRHPRPVRQVRTTEKTNRKR